MWENATHDASYLLRHHTTHPPCPALSTRVLFQAQFMGLHTLPTYKSRRIKLYQNLLIRLCFVVLGLLDVACILYPNVWRWTANFNWTTSKRHLA